MVEFKQSIKRKVDKIIVHCSDTYADMDIDVSDIRKWHKEERGWKDVGYHFIITRSGKFQTGRDLDNDGDVFEEIGAHVAGMNATTIGICLVGGKGKDGKPENNFTKQQMNVLAGLISMIQLKYPDATTHGHNEFSNKACPSFDVQKWKKKVNLK